MNEAKAPHPHTRAVMAVLFRAYQPVKKRTVPTHTEFLYAVADLFSISTLSARDLCREFGFDAYQLVRKPRG